MKELLDKGLIHGDCLTVTGATVLGNLENIPRITDLNQVNDYCYNYYNLINAIIGCTTTICKPSGSSRTAYNNLEGMKICR